MPSWITENGLQLRSPDPSGDAGLAIQQNAIELQQTADIGQSVARDLLIAAGIAPTLTSVLAIAAAGTYAGAYSGTYSGWCWKLAAIQNFDRIAFYAFPFNLNYLPTQIRVFVATDKEMTNVLASATLHVSYLASQLNTPVLHTVDFDHLVANSGSVALYFGILSNNYVGFFAGDTTAVETWYATNKSLTAPSWSRSDPDFAPPQLTISRVTRTTVRGYGSQNLLDDLTSAVLRRIANAALSIPSYLYSAAGIECNVYWENVLRSKFFDDLEFDVTSAIGTHQEERWTFTPVDGDVTSGNIRDVSWAVSVNHDYDVLDSASATLRIAKSTAGTGVTRKVLSISDSTGDGWIPLLGGLFGADAMAIQLVGTHLVSGSYYDESTGGDSWNRWFTEGILEAGDALSQLSAWSLTGVTGAKTNNGILYYKLTDSAGTRTVEVFDASAGGAGDRIAYGSRSGDGAVTLSQDNSSGISGTVTVAYTIDDTDVANNKLTVYLMSMGESFDFAAYLTDNSITLEADDWVLIHLGLNDVCGSSSDAAVYSNIETYIKPAIEGMLGGAVQCRGLVGEDSPAATSIRGAVSGIRVGICLTIPPSHSQDAAGANYGNSLEKKRVARNLALYREWIIAQYDSALMQSRGIYVVPLHANLDTVHNMGSASVAANSRTTTEITRQTNLVHPATDGYEQMADSLYAFLKCQET
jgi:lysophospholipase L1-like esterase